jgi:RND superfamily putative drug exporter
MPENEAIQGFDAMADGFGRSRGMETAVVVDIEGLVYDNGTDTYDVAFLDAIDRLSDDLESMDIVLRADPSTYIEGERIDRVGCWEVFGEEYKASCLQRSVGRNRHTVTVTVVLKEDPFSKESIDSIQDIRAHIDKTKEREPTLAGTTILVGGATAEMGDIEDTIESSMGLMRVVVIVLIFVLLLIVLGSILIPITAIISIGLSISWTLAATMLVFQYVKGIPVMWLMPIILFVVLMGLGMDYNIFIITRMREEVLKGYSDRVAIRRAVESTGGIITACGAIMAGAFGSMMLSVMGMLQQFGFALFFAILLDAFVIRIYLMPAIIVLLRKWNWWAPGRLQRVRRGEDGAVIIRGEKKGHRRKKTVEEE